ncbi:hypothetical protein GCM10009798_14210 [Nocardioides panacihumi]|uniref:Uncharacterized protein n=1 Tax=Nocardioides panacihumi TaxID=400774 RepID=A0ABN2QPW2_9ACTN
MVLRTPRRTPRTWLRAQVNTSHRVIDGWNDLTDRMQPPAGSLQSFVRLHTEVRGEHLASLWEAFLQWVRVYGRFEQARYSELRTPMPWPSSRLCQPSVAVDDLWQLLADDADMWRQLPEHVQVMARVPVRDPHSRFNLDKTYLNAYLDEYGSLRLPLLFRIDEILGIYEGRLYRGECLSEYCREKSDAGLDPEPGRTCLHQIPWFPSGQVTGGGGG